MDSFRNAIERQATAHTAPADAVCDSALELLAALRRAVKFYGSPAAAIEAVKAADDGGLYFSLWHVETLNELCCSLAPWLEAAAKFEADNAAAIQAANEAAGVAS